MATNKPYGDGHRIGAVRKRSQRKTKIQGERHWTKRNRTSGRFMDQKADEKKFKGVRKEAAEAAGAEPRTLTGVLNEAFVFRGNTP